MIRWIGWRGWLTTVIAAVVLAIVPAGASAQVQPYGTNDYGGFRNVLPTGRGLFGFSNEDQAVAAIDSINSDYPRHRQGSREIAREYFAADVVLKKILTACGV